MAGYKTPVDLGGDGLGPVRAMPATELVSERGSSGTPAGSDAECNKGCLRANAGEIQSRIQIFSNGISSSGRAENRQIWNKRVEAYDVQGLAG